MENQPKAASGSEIISTGFIEMSDFDAKKVTTHSPDIFGAMKNFQPQTAKEIMEIVNNKLKK
jgi:hypothetical protein